MKSGIGTGTCVVIAIVVSVGLAAQGNTTSSQQNAASSANVITVTGCVQKGDQSATGTSGSAASSASASTDDSSKTYVLTNVMRSGAGEATGTSGTASAPRATSSVKYPIDADESKLAPHVGHKVEVTGTFESSSTAPGVSSVPKLKVESIRMLGRECTS